MSIMLNSGMFSHQHVSGLANQFPAAISKESAHLLIDQNNRPGLIDHDNSVRRGLKQFAILHFSTPALSHEKWRQRRWRKTLGVFNLHLGRSGLQGKSSLILNC